MICKFCETENPDGATYCKQCGKRIDGIRLCKACGHANGDDASFCNACGARLVDEPVSAPVLEEAAAADNRGTAAKAKYDWRKIVTLCGGISAIVGVFFALLFTFFVGLTTNVSGVTSSVSAGLGLVDDKANFWYFFKDAYTDIADNLEGLKLYTTSEAYYLLSEYLPVAIGTLIAAATLVGVTVLSILAAVRFGRKLAGKSDKDYMGLCIAAVMVYVLGTLLFLALMNTTVNYTYTGSSNPASYSASIVPNAATTAGLVLSLLFLALALGCRVAVKGKELLQKNTLVPICLTLGGIVLASVLLSLAANVCCEMIYSRTGMKSGMGLSPWYLLSSAAEKYRVELFEYYTDNNNYFAPLKAPVGVTVTAILTGVLQLAFVVLAAMALLRRMQTLSDGTHKSGLGLAISIMVIAVAYLALTLVAVDQYFSYMEITESSYHAAYAAPITALVFAVLYLALSITHTVLRKKFEKTE